MSLLPIPAIMRERVALSTMSDICTPFLTDPEECLHRRIPREALGMIKCDHTSSPDPGGASRVDSSRGVRDGARVRSPHSPPECPVRVFAIDDERISRLRLQLGCDQ